MTDSPPDPTAQSGLDDTAGQVATLAARVAELRQGRRWTQAALARSTGLSRAYIHAIENGAAKDPSGRTLALLAQSLDVHVLDLMEAAGAIPPGYQQGQIQTELDMSMYLRRQRKLSEGFVNTIIRLIRLAELDEKGADPPG